MTDYRHDPKLPPVKAARAYCTACMNGHFNDIVKCTSPNCAMYPYRSGRRVGHLKLAVIRANCLQCVGNVRAEVTNCTGYDCPFYPYRFGTSPGSKKGLARKGLKPGQAKENENG